MVKIGSGLLDKTVRIEKINHQTKTMLEVRDTENQLLGNRNSRNKTSYELVEVVSYFGKWETHIPLIWKLQTKHDSGGGLVVSQNLLFWGLRHQNMVLKPC